jgi:uncharacterized phiE125 gp8 family phage protein
MTVAQLQERARIVTGDEESTALMQSIRTAAREQIEGDIDCALTTQQIEVAFDRLPVQPLSYGFLYSRYVPLPLPRPPLQSVDSITLTNPDGTTADLDPATTVTVDALSMPARVFWTGPPLPFFTTAIQPLRMTLTVGWTAATLPEALRTCIGLLASHMLTTGRDRVVVGERVAAMPFNYEEIIAGYRIISLV